ncbi:hypothetical protein KL949_001467 [Ogataea haglerorum]|uniref:uncharacterized protein n=1 Tax=Ogataea haglerorum TaxID=1937702 RepID=UPI001C895433|nr:uncharacterized protein KL911_002249 [Ogataea haglerorum]KAG7719888.1 hypothetical protein KL913_001857 [Ogataea haglerorum]KAG7721735.1 hypothetical protein KL949_001467 [Ogataea haglerorum]KAG7754810.1 hypothetical protein KL911_002249 [Ogataea haglerorum]KAG7759474.1 hypothetical protein KL947_001855 [Ogataea haglerorum]KAG7770063.1 hypothetical protein KL931_002582 [Ogataea haglerorum]
MSRTRTQPVRERKRELEAAEESSSEDELQVEGLLDGAESEEDSESEQFESADEDQGQDQDSDAEFNRILAEGSSGEEEDEDEPKEPSITDRLSGIKIRTLSSSSSANGEVRTKFSDGRERILRPEIDPVYDSDDSDREETNTIGNVPLSAYDEYPHIGYDINGKRIMRPAQGSALDQLLESIDLPEGWTGLLDKETGSSLNISAEELELIRKIERNENPDESVNPYEPTIEWFTSKTETMPLTAVPEPKRRFVPSKHEAKRIMKIVKAIREGRIVPPHLKKQQEEEDELNFDLWGGDVDNTQDHVMTLRAPKLPPPTNEESYNPPEEYLLSEEERKRWEETDPSERERNFVPQKYGALRKVPGYQESVRERFERCLDLYLAPRVRKQKLNIDPESLIPELPSPKDLKPFPVRTSTVYEGHTGRVRALSVHPSGNWLATGADDGTVRVWEVLTGRELYQYAIVEDDEDHVEALEWNPKPDVALLAVTCGETIFLLVPPIFGYELENRSKLLVEDGWGYAKTGHDTVEGEDGENSGKSLAAVWHKPSEEQYAHGVCAVVRTSRGGSAAGTFKRVSWHRRGDYFVTVAPEGGNKTSVLIHQLSRHATQSPFRKSKGIVMDAKFHPSKPVLVVMSQRYIRIYNLQQQQLEKKLLPGARWLSCLDIHPRGGDHILAGSYDKRVLWHDLDLSATPYKTLRYHEKAVRAVAYHKGGYPLFCSAADDGSVHVFHGTVYDDLMSNPLLVPLKKLTGHKVVNSLGVLNVCWHPAQPWLFTAGADHTARLWTD